MKDAIKSGGNIFHRKTNQRAWVPLSCFALSLEDSRLSKIASEEVGAPLRQAGAGGLHLQAGHGGDQVVEGDHQVVPLPRLYIHTRQL